ncbi:uncharacterized protein K02A2.6 [Trichonephila clavipes]|nr:uncharacterized protein K02A2.6 [Trichonephila clavipes]
MEQQIADLLRQNQDLIRALQIREDSYSHKVTVQFEKFDEENEINFLGHRIDSKGLHKTDEKISAVINAPVPRNVHEELRQETSKDIELGPLLRALREGKDLQGREAQYTIEDGCIMYGQRVCIPRKFRKNVLEELHAGHLGIVKMKAIARSFVYWKNIDNDIEEAAKKKPCRLC